MVDCTTECFIVYMVPSVYFIVLNLVFAGINDGLFLFPICSVRTMNVEYFP